jgi:hypothetical protein
MGQPNEPENLLLASLKRLSEEFEQREKRMTELSSECVASFEEQSSTLMLGDVYWSLRGSLRR